MCKGVPRVLCLCLLPAVPTVCRRWLQAPTLVGRALPKGTGVMARGSRDVDYFTLVT